MNDRPDTLELLHVVNHTLAQEILPHAKAEQLYTLRMIANALGIAARELESRDINATSEARGLNLLYGGQRDAEDLHTRNRQFALDIRRGLFENNGTQESDLRQHLVATARAKLAVTYPKGLGPSKSNK